MADGSLYDRTLARCQPLLDEGGAPVVVLDLDGTVFDNGPRTWQILADFFEITHRGAERRLLDKVPHTGMPYTLQDTLQLAGIGAEPLLDEAVAFWKARFFTHAYQRFDVPLPGAVSFIRRLYDAGVTLCYLTGRDYPGMGVGCVESLHSYGLPAAMVRTALVLKPDFDTPDIAFKREAVRFIDQLGTVVASFDNEPGNCNLFRELWPEALVGLADTQHAPGAPRLTDGVFRFQDFLS